MIPAFRAWIESPEPGISASTTVSAIESTPTSLWPVPTVSRKTTSLPRGVEHEQRLQRRLGEAAEVPARAHRADEDVRGRGSGRTSRMRSPSSAPCVNGLDGSTEITPTVCSAARTCRISAETRLDLPTPGAR